MKKKTQPPPECLMSKYTADDGMADDYGEEMAEVSVDGVDDSGGSPQYSPTNGRDSSPTGSWSRGGEGGGMQGKGPLRSLGNKKGQSSTRPPGSGVISVSGGGETTKEQQPSHRPETPPKEGGNLLPDDGSMNSNSNGSDPQALVDTLYTLWLRHAPSLYDFCTTHVLEWPTSTIGFLGDSRREIPGRDYAVHQIFFGTNTPSVNYVNVYHTFLPCALDDQEDYSSDDYDAFHGYSGRFVDVAPLMQRYLRVVHDGPAVNIRSMPQKPQILATRGRKNLIYIYDMGRRRSEPETTQVKADLRLKGHLDEGYGMSWNPQTAGLLASAADDGLIKIWDIEAQIDLCGTRASMDMGPVQTMTQHHGTVEDVSWHHSHDSILASVGSDKQLMLWDTRSPIPSEQATVHREACTSVSFHPTASFLVATASADKTVRCWDLRTLQRKPIAEFWGHTDTVTGVEWAPFNDTVLMSWSDDRTVICWDLSKIDEVRKDVEDEHAKPELVFKHLGHTGKVRQAAWCPTPEDEWTVMSCDDNNFIQTWAPYERVYNDQADLEAYNTDVV